MMKLIVLIFLLYSFNSFSIESFPRIEKLKSQLYKLESKEGYPESIYLLSNEFLKKPNISNTEKKAGIMYLGYYYAEVQRWSKSNEYYKKALKIQTNTETGKQIQCAIFIHLSNNFITLQDWFLAKKYADSALSFNFKLSPNAKAQLFDTKANYELRSGNFQKTINFLDSATYYYNIYDKEVCGKLFGSYVLAYANLNKLENLDFYIDKNRIHFLKFKNKEIYSNNLVKIREAYVLIGNFEKGSNLTKEIDSINTLRELVERNSKLDELEKKYKTQLLNKDNLALKKSLSLNKKILISVFLFVVLLVAFITIIWWNYKSKKKLTKKLELTNKEIENQNKKLENQNSFNQRMLAVVSHDIKGSLISSNLLLNKYLKMNSILNDSILSALQNSIENSQKVLDSLLNWMKLEVEKSKVSFNTDCVEIMGEINHEFKDALKQKNIDLKIEIVNTHPKILLHKILLKIALRNLISNAIKYSFDGATIIVRLDNDMVEIKDFGIGLSQVQIEKLFKSDVVSQLGTQDETGFGIGLFLTQQLLIEHGFEIKVKSNSDFTLFSIYKSI